MKWTDPRLTTTRLIAQILNDLSHSSMTAFTAALLTNDMSGIKSLLSCSEATADAEAEENLAASLKRIATNSQTRSILLDAIVDTAAQAQSPMSPSKSLSSKGSIRGGDMDFGNLESMGPLLKWLCGMLFFHTAKREWAEDVRKSDESNHPPHVNENFKRTLKFPFAKNLFIQLDGRTNVSESQLTLMDAESTVLKTDTPTFLTTGSQLIVAFNNLVKTRSWGYRLNVSPKYDADEAFDEKGANAKTILLEDNALTVLTTFALRSQNASIEELAIETLSNLLFAGGVDEQSSKRRTRIFDFLKEYVHVKADSGGGGVFKTTNRNRSKEVQTICTNAKVTFQQKAGDGDHSEVDAAENTDIYFEVKIISKEFSIKVGYVFQVPDATFPLCDKCTSPLAFESTKPKRDPSKCEMCSNLANKDGSYFNCESCSYYRCMSCAGEVLGTSQDAIAVQVEDALDVGIGNISDSVWLVVDNNGITSSGGPILSQLNVKRGVTIGVLLRKDAGICDFFVGQQEKVSVRFSSPNSTTARPAASLSFKSSVAWNFGQDAWANLHDVQADRINDRWILPTLTDKENGESQAALSWQVADFKLKAWRPLVIDFDNTILSDEAVRAEKSLFALNGRRQLARGLSGYASKNDFDREFVIQIQHLMHADDEATQKWMALAALTILKKEANADLLLKDQSTADVILNSVKNGSIPYKELLGGFYSRQGFGFKFMSEAFHNASSNDSRGILLESEHNYKDNFDEVYEIDLPGSRGLEIIFDARTKTESNCDKIQFYAENPRLNPDALKLGSEYSGESVNFPSQDKPLFLNENHVWMRFTTDGGVNYW